MRTEGVKGKEKRENIFSGRSKCVSPLHPTSNLNIFVFTFSHLLSTNFISLYFYPLFRGAAGSAALHHAVAAAVMISEHLHASSQNRRRSITSRASAALCSRGFFVFLVLGIGGCVFHPHPLHPTIPLPLLLFPSTYLSDLSNVGLSYLLFFPVRIPFEGCSSSL